MVKLTMRPAQYVLVKKVGKYMKAKQIMKENLFVLVILIWLITMIGYILLWRNVLSITILTGIIILGLLLGILILIIGLTKKLSAGFYVFSVIMSFMILLIATPTSVMGNRDSRWRVGNTVFSYERALDFNRRQLNLRIEDRQFSRNHSRAWSNGGSVSLEVITRPNYRFTEEQLEQLTLIADEIENIYRDARFLWEEIIWIRYSEHVYWLRTYPTDSDSLTMTRRAGLSTIYDVEDNIAVVEVRFPINLTMDVLRLPLIGQYGEFHGGNFELALQLQQLLLSNLVEDMGIKDRYDEAFEEETRPFELAREVLTGLEE